MGNLKVIAKAVNTYSQRKWEDLFDVTIINKQIALD